MLPPHCSILSGLHPPAALWHTGPPLHPQHPSLPPLQVAPLFIQPIPGMQPCSLSASQLFFLLFSSSCSPTAKNNQEFTALDLELSPAPLCAVPAALQLTRFLLGMDGVGTCCGGTPHGPQRAAPQLTMGFCFWFIRAKRFAVTFPLRML